MKPGRLRVAIHANTSSHQQRAANALAHGFASHGHQVVRAGFDEPAPCDVAVIWGWKQPRVIEATPAVLVAEGAHVGPRLKQVSLGWNGLGGRATYPECLDTGERWNERYGALMQPWNWRDGYALVLGQVEGDAALAGICFSAWVQQTVNELAHMGQDVVYRPHPLIRDGWCPSGATLSPGSRMSIGGLAKDLAGASFAVTYNSTSAVECVLAGVPTVACDAGSMAWDVTSHCVEEYPIKPDRTPWAHRLAWSQWAWDELANGDAVDALLAVRAV